MGVLGNGRTGARRGSATGRGMPHPRRAVVRGGRVPRGGSPRATGHAGLASRAMSAAFAAILVAGMVPAALLATCGVSGDVFAGTVRAAARPQSFRLPRVSNRHRFM